MNITSRAQCPELHRKPLWVISHGTGEHRGHLESFSDRGGTDVTYIFKAHCGRTLVVSGSLLRASHIAKPDDTGICPHVEA